MKHVLLTFDLEEFDLPLESDQPISQEQMFEIPKQGLMNLLSLLDKYNIRATFFTTATFAKKYPSLLKQISKTHEIACHGYSHSHSLILENLKKAKQEIEKIINKSIRGFRAPKWNLKSTVIIEQVGFDYDSSSHPIYLPGRYFNINKKRGLHKIGTLTEIPLSTLPPNFSIFWLAFKNFPLIYSKAFTKINFLTKDYTMLLFHPWEFADISKFKLKWYVNTVYGERLLRKLEEYILFCKKKGYNFETIEDYIGMQKLL